MEGEEIDTILSNEVYAGLFTRDELMDIMRLKWNKTFESQTIKRAVRSKALIPWDNGNKLYCDLKVAAGYTSYSMRNIESTWFSSNKPLVLGSIAFASVSNSQGYCNFQCEMHIIEYDTITFDTNASKRFICTKSFNLQRGGSQTVSLDSPIIIKPTKTYEIQLRNISGYAFYHSCVWKTEVNLGGNIVVKYHAENPANSNSNRRGLVEGMNFNRI